MALVVVGSAGVANGSRQLISPTKTQKRVLLQVPAAGTVFVSTRAADLETPPAGVIRGEAFSIPGGGTQNFPFIVAPGQELYGAALGGGALVGVSIAESLEDMSETVVDVVFGDVDESEAV